MMMMIMMMISDLSGISIISNGWKICLPGTWRSYVLKEDFVTPKSTTS